MEASSFELFLPFSKMNLSSTTEAKGKIHFAIERMRDHEGGGELGGGGHV